MHSIDQWRNHIESEDVNKYSYFEGVYCIFSKNFRKFSGKIGINFRKLSGGNFRTHNPTHITQNHTEGDNETHTQSEDIPRKIFPWFGATPPWCRYHLGHCSLRHVFWPKVGGATAIGFIYPICFLRFTKNFSESWIKGLLQVTQW